MYLTNEEKKRIQQLLTDIPDVCHCKSCQALSKEKNILKSLLDELKQTQAYIIQSEKMAALGKLAAGMIHELNNPIGVRNSAADVCNRSVSKITEVLRKNQSIKVISDNKLLQISMEALHINNLVTIKASKRITEIVKSLNSFVQFFRKLLQNAIQSIPEKGEITIRTFTKNNNTFIQIADTGIGIPSKKMKNLFEPNFSKKGNRVKAGMGLFISLNIIKKHHGQIKIESEVGKGSTFTIIFPKNKN